MIQCPHCSAELKAETLKGSGDLYCPACGAPLADSEDFGLSSLGGSPADATMRPDSGAPSSLGGSSFAGSGFADSDVLSDDAPSSDVPDATLQASDGSPSHDDLDDDDDDSNDVTMAFGERYDAGGESEDLIMLEGEEDEDFDDLDSRSPGESLDATVDFGHFARLDRDEGGLPGADMTMAFGGKKPQPKRDDKPSDSDSGPDLTQMVGVPGLLDGGRPKGPSDGTISADSDKPSSGVSDSSLGKSSELVGRDSAGRDEAGDKTESPSTHAEGDTSNRDSATLAFDSERRSDRVGTPQPIDITGLSSGGTIPRGPLEEGRGSQLLKPGDSQIVGDESVRLRAFELADPAAVDPLVIDYAIEGEAGKGGMGVVYKARQQSLNRLVAIKQIKSDLGASVSDCNKFISEAVITGQLEHPNIAPVHDLGLAADGLPFYAMKFVEGQDWEESVKSNSEEENLSILIQVAQAIAFAHSKNVIHRDLKPGNVRLGAFGEVLVMDWGLAARLDEGAEIQPAGTPIYMPPETALEYLDYAKGRVVGRKVESSRRRIPAGKYCDVYLLGALLFKIVTGRAPHRGKTTFECLRAAAKNEIVKVKRSSELLDIAYKAMATDPENRHTSALEFIEAIKAYQAHAQSIKIAKRASQELRAAETLLESPQADSTEVYACYSRAQHGYQNALELWSENSKARRRLKRTLRHFAEAAYKNGDYDLALSLLDDQSEDDADLRATVLKDQKSRNARLAWFKTLQYATAASLMLALGFIGYSVVLKQDAISKAAEIADQVKLLASQETKLTEQESKVAQAEADAVRLTEEAQKQRDIAEKQTQIAEVKTREAEAKTIEVDRLERLADTKQAEANAAIKVADAKSKEAAQQSYYAALGRIRATLADNGTFAAWKVMREAAAAIPQERANDPEWVSLQKTLDWRSEAREVVSEADAIGMTVTAVSADGATLFTAANTPQRGVSVTIRRGDAATETFALPGKVTAIASDPTGRYLAVIGDGLRVVDMTNKRPLAVADAGALRRATCVAFHPTGPEVLVGDADAEVTRWTIDEGKLTRLETDPVVNDGAITAVGYSPDGRQRFAADESGRIVLRRSRDGAVIDDRETYSHAMIESGSPHITAATMTAETGGRLAYGCSDGAVYEIANWWPEPDAGAVVIDEETGVARPALASRIAGTDYLDARPTRLRSTHAGAVTQVGYADGGQLILSAGGDTLLVQRSGAAPDGEAIKTERRYHDARVTSLVVGGEGVAYSADERGRVLRWSIKVAPEQFVVDAPKNAAVVAVSYDAASDALAFSDAGGFVHRWSDVAKPADRQTLFAGHSDNRDLRAWRLAGDTPLILTVAPEERAIVGPDGRERRITVNRACLWGGDDGLLRRSIDLGERLIVSCDTDNRLLYAASSGRLLNPEDERPVAMVYSLDTGVGTALWSERARVSAITPLPAGAPHGAQVAVGLRDGQVYLWGPTAGRIELSRSSARPHWRPIRSLAYDVASQKLYSGDNNGLVAAWPLAGGDVATTQLRDATGSSIAPIVKLDVTPDGSVLAVRRRSNGLVLPSLLNADMQVIAGLGVVADADIDPATGGVVILRREAGDSVIEQLSRQASGWVATAKATTPQRLSNVNATSGGWLAWGSGVVEWRPSAGGAYALATRVVSRATPVALVSDANSDEIVAMTASGSLDVWKEGGELRDQSPIGQPGRPTAACKTDTPGQWLVALAEGEDATRVELWDSQAKRFGARVAEGIRGECHAVAYAGGNAVIAMADRVVVASMQGGPASELPLPAAPVSVAVRPDGDAFTVAGASGEVWVGRRAGGRWRLSPLDQAGVTSVAYTPDGSRLLLGVESGRVVLLELEDSVADAVATRTLLTFAGHNDRVVRIDVEPTADGVSIVSGDASGRVIVRRI